jgi:PTS system fructose-specific IIC component
MAALADWLHGAGPLLTLSIVILVGVGGGALARRVRLPGVTGQILAGVLMGEAGLRLFDPGALAGLTPLTHLALGLIAVTVGAHLNIPRLRNAGRRLSFLLLIDSTLTPLVVYFGLTLFAGAPRALALLLAAVSIASAPATIVSVIREAHAKGVFVKTLIAALALNDMACIVLFEVARAVGATSWGSGLASSDGGFDEAVLGLALATGIGTLVAVAMDQFSRVVVRPDRVATGAVLALVFTSGLASSLDVSPLLACVVLGAVQTNIAPTRSHVVDSVFANFEPTILAIFFTLAGMHLTTSHLSAAGVVAVAYFCTRAVGKISSASLAMRLAQATERVRRYLGIALLPQAGVAVGLVIVIQGDPKYADIAGLFGAAVLSVVAVNEIVGPVLTRFALSRAGEVGQDRVRLIDFLQEENILTRFRAASMDEAIEALVDLLMRSHGLRAADRQALIDSIREREAQASTCLGGGLAVPHGILPSGNPMVGVMALSADGLEFPTPDGNRVHCMVLLATSPEERDRHLQVLAALARTIGIDPAFQEQLFNATSAAHAWEILHGDDSEDFNYFLEDHG